MHNLNTVVFSPKVPAFKAYYHPKSFFVYSLSTDNGHSDCMTYSVGSGGSFMLLRKLAYFTEANLR